MYPLFAKSREREEKSLPRLQPSRESSERRGPARRTSATATALSRASSVAARRASRSKACAGKPLRGRGSGGCAGTTCTLHRCQNSKGCLIISNFPEVAMISKIEPANAGASQKCAAGGAAVNKKERPKAPRRLVQRLQLNPSNCRWMSRNKEIAIPREGEKGLQEKLRSQKRRTRGLSAKKKK